MYHYDVIIIGAGPAGLTAGIYCSRAGLNTLIIGDNKGGQVANINTIENYPGHKNISGFELSENLFNQAKECGIDFIQDTVDSVVNTLDEKIVYVGIKNLVEYKAKVIIISTGRKHKRLNIPGESKFYGLGVSYCGTCDGPLFKNREIAIIGGGNTALQEALYLSKFVKSIKLIHRGYLFRADNVLIEAIMNNPKISIEMNTKPISINGNIDLESLTVLKTDKHNQTSILHYNIEGVFIFIGQEPNTDFCKDIITLDQDNYIICNSDLMTNIDGIFVAGDVHKKHTYQIVTAAADGAIAAMNAYNYITHF